MHSLRCAGLALSEAACAAWYARREEKQAPTGGGGLMSAPRHGEHVRPCASANCHGHGVCDRQTGICACEAGYNGSACEGFNLRECNGATDGLWHASHCSGECDETKGYCWCPGKLNQRPMADTCQVKHMPVDAFAALKLKPDPAWIRFAPNGSKLDAGLLSLDKAEQAARRKVFSSDLEKRVANFVANPAKHAQAVRRFWFGQGSTARAVEISEHGVPHAVPRVSDGGGSRKDGEEVIGRRLSAKGEAAAGEAPAVMDPSEHSGERGSALYQKLAARPTWPRDDLLGGSYGTAPSGEADQLASNAGEGTKDAADDSWCEATPQTSPVPKTCPCLFDGLYGPLCDGRNEPFCLNQCSGHGVCDATGGGFCHCDVGYFGVDCSKTRGADGRVTLHAKHAAITRSLSPSIYVYELWDHTSLILQYRAYRGYCVHRTFGENNETDFNDAYAYSIETALHEMLLSSAHRTLDATTADFFYVRAAHARSTRTRSTRTLHTHAAHACSR